MQVPLAGLTYKIFLSLAICLIAVVFWAPKPGTESVRTELIQKQRETGLTFAWMDEGVSEWMKGTAQAVLLETRTAVPLKDSLQAFHPEGFSIRDYQQTFAIGACWSNDQTKLAATMMNSSTRRVIFGILDLNSKQVHAIAINADQRAYVASQCWSKDDKQLVYELDGAVRLYNLENDRADAVAKGTDPAGHPMVNGSDFGTAIHITECTETEVLERNCFAISGGKPSLHFIGRRIRGLLPM